MSGQFWQAVEFISGFQIVPVGPEICANVSRDGPTPLQNQTTAVLRPVGLQLDVTRGLKLSSTLLTDYFEPLIFRFRNLQDNVHSPKLG